MVRRLDFFMVVNKLVSQYKISDVMPRSAPIYKSFQAVNENDYFSETFSIKT